MKNLYRVVYNIAIHNMVLIKKLVIKFTFLIIDT